MKTASVLLVAVVAASLLASAFAGEDPERCAFGCAAVEDPVCGYYRGEHRTFSNECAMDLEGCFKRQPWRKVAGCACVPLVLAGK